MNFGSVCSGIEAASVAFNPLGWKAQFFSEIDPFACAVLAHHYPSVTNLGDMNDFRDWPDADLDVLCGGTPCQSYSNAGLRAGLDDPRGQLMLTFGAVAERYRPLWLLWENVPGVLSSNGGRDFGAFLGLLGYLGYGFAYRVLDAQFFGLAQRRKRVFVVARIGDWKRAAAVLFERESLRWDIETRSRERKEAAGGAARGSGGSGVVGPLMAGEGPNSAGFNGFTSNQSVAAGHLIPLAFKSGQSEAAGGTFITENISPTLQASNNGSTAVPSVLAYGGNNTSGPIDVATGVRAKGGTGHGDFESETFIAFDTMQITHPENRSNPRPGDPVGTLAKGGHAPAIAFHGSQDPDVSGDVTHPVGRNQGQETCAMIGAGVRRLTPRECERLQGFEDDYTLIPLRNAKGKLTGKFAKDGPRYKAIGNSWAVPNVRWIGRRIQLIDQL